jgi:glycosyltransferase involved in cell wall biosynthesis
MIIGYDAKRVFHNYTGLGNYSRTLLKNMSVYYPDHVFQLFSPSIQSNSETNFFIESPNFKIYYPKFNFLWRSLFIQRAIKKSTTQLFHGLSNEIPFGLKKKSIVTIHDLIFKTRPQDYSLIDRKIYDLKVKYAAENCAQIIAISEATKMDLINFYKIPENRISVLYQSCDSMFENKFTDPELTLFKAKHHLPHNYLLYVGSVIPRKNLLNIVKSLTLLPSSLKIPLVVIGPGNSYKKEVLEYIVQHNLERLIFWKNIHYRELPALYQGANAFIYPSFAEGFGIPVLESLTSGTPVITSKISSLPEAGGNASIYIDPTSPDEIAVAIQKILEDELFKKEIVTKGKAYTRLFDGKSLSNQLMKIYAEITQ